MTVRLSDAGDEMAGLTVAVLEVECPYSGVSRGLITVASQSVSREVERAIVPHSPHHSHHSVI